MAVRIMSEDALAEEAAHATIRCRACDQWIRYDRRTDVVTDRARDQRHVLCPCGKERVIALGVSIHIKLEEKKG